MSAGVRARFAPRPGAQQCRLRPRCGGGQSFVLQFARVAPRTVHECSQQPLPSPQHLRELPSYHRGAGALRAVCGKLRLRQARRRRCRRAPGTTARVPGKARAALRCARPATTSPPGSPRSPRVPAGRHTAAPKRQGHALPELLARGAARAARVLPRWAGSEGGFGRAPSPPPSLPPCLPACLPACLPLSPRARPNPNATPTPTPPPPPPHARAPRYPPDAIRGAPLPRARSSPRATRVDYVFRSTGTSC